jgi:hypothetical protein
MIDNFAKAIIALRVEVGPNLSPMEEETFSHKHAQSLSMTEFSAKVRYCYSQTLVLQRAMGPANSVCYNQNSHNTTGMVYLVNMG